MLISAIAHFCPFSRHILKLVPPPINGKRHYHQLYINLNYPIFSLFTGSRGGAALYAVVDFAVSVLILAAPADVVVHLKHQALRHKIHMVIAFVACYGVAIAALELVIACEWIEADGNKIEIAILIR